MTQPPDKAQPAVPEECRHAIMNRIGGGDWQCDFCKKWFTDDEVKTLIPKPVTPSPSLELGPDTIIGEAVVNIGYCRERQRDRNSGETGQFTIPCRLEEVYPQYQQALLKGGLDGEKVALWLGNKIGYCPVGFHEAIESGALDVTPDNEGKGV